MKSKESRVPDSAKLLKISYPFKNPVNSIDPHKIHFIEEALLSQPLNSKLVNVFQNGKINGEMASDIYWNGEAYELTIRSYKTSGGVIIDAEDAYISLLRIVAIDKNTHGSLKNLICPNSVVKNLNDKCEGLKLRDNKIVLKPKSKVNKSLIIQLLASTDFTIIPKDQIDFNHPENLNLDLSNTTGLYFLLEDDGKGNFTFAINPNHFQYSHLNFQKLNFKYGFGEQSLADLKARIVNYIPTNGYLTPLDIKNLDENYIKYSSHPILLYSIRPTKKSLKKYSDNTRLAIGRILSEKVRKLKSSFGSVTTNQFFPIDGDGQLSEIQEKKLESLVEKAKNEINYNNVEFTVSVYKDLYDEFVQLLSDIPYIKIVQLRDSPWVLPEEEQPDFYLATGDSSFFANISLLSYFFNNGVFGTKEDGEIWLDKYTKVMNKKERIKMLQDLHFKFLAEGRVFPSFFIPYIALSNIPMNIGLSKHFASNPFFLLTAKEDE
ncbi:MAG: hypothetical protein H6625_03680 [Bdellovibrionaceae bacterium]|nr:hypothetical protein [Pseudobdellovibrionaceae bacterium]